MKQKNSVHNQKLTATDYHKRIVECCIINGFNTHQTAGVLGMSVTTLTKNYQTTIAHAKERLVARASNRLVHGFALSDDLLQHKPELVLKALQILLNSKGGWASTQAIENKTTHVIDNETMERMKTLDIDALIALGKGIEKLEG